jgi:hypothetical protein
VEEVEATVCPFAAAAATQSELTPRHHVKTFSITLPVASRKPIIV